MKRNIRKILLSILFFCSLSICLILPCEARTNAPILRVAFYPLDGFFEYDAQGNEAGYGVEVLNKIS